MATTSFSSPTLRYQTLRGILGLIDLLSSLVLALVFRNILPDLQPKNLLLEFWLLSSGVAWLVSRGSPPLLALDTYGRSFLAPLYSLAGCLLLFAISRQYYSLAFLGFTTSSWILCMLLARVVLRSLAPKLRVLLLGQEAHKPPYHVQLEVKRMLQPDQVRLNEADLLLIDTELAYGGDWRKLITHAQVIGVPVVPVAEISEELTGKVSVELLQSSYMDTGGRFNPTYVSVKRTFDIFATLLVSPVLLVLCGLVALVVLIDVGRPILFWQTRVGLDNRPFRMVKFRSMRRNSEQGGAAFAQKGDARVSKLGKVLRKFRLDELPQFWNVLRGEMSIIGPRPEQGTFVEQFTREIPLYQVRHWVRPGISGWAQVNQGYAAGTDETVEKLRFDLYYIKHFSFWLDLRVVAKTIWTILSGFGAR